MSRVGHDLVVEELSAGYGQRLVIRNASFTHTSGSIVAIIGVNGSGKSTLLKALCGQVPVSRGRVRYGEVDLLSATPDELHGIGVSYVPQGGLIVPSLRVREHFDLVARRSSKGDPEVTRTALMERFSELVPLLDRLAGNLSGGERMLLSQALLVAQRTSLWLMDEPSAGLAPQALHRMVEFLRTSNKEEGIGILMVEHNRLVTNELTNLTMTMQDGLLLTPKHDTQDKQKPTNFGLR